MPIVLKPGPTVKQKSQKSEKTAAKLFGGRMQPASGAMRHAKGDIKTDVYLIEDKITGNGSYSLKKTIWEKIRLEAYNRRRIPMMRITVQGRTLCVVEENHMLQLLEK